MLMTKERRPAFQTVEGWARSVLFEAGAIRECEEHGWAKDRADPHARERAFLIARQDPPPGVSPVDAAAAIRVRWMRPATPARSAHRTAARLPFSELDPKRTNALVFEPRKRPVYKLRLFRDTRLPQSIFPSGQHLELSVGQPVLDVLDPKIRVAGTH
jgi:hypothetical protein